MRISKLNDDFSAAPQIQYDHVKVIAKQGFKAIVNHRPDGEEAGQPLSKALAKAAKAGGHCLPLYSVQTGPRHADR